jgi:choline dehydrogenase-like flavoprotein
LGGSSCANVLLYHRGNANDYDSWAESTGDKDWSPENVLPYFKKSEDDFRGESKYHGAGGEYAVSDVRYQNPLSKTFLSACGENGYPSNDDFNNWSRSQEGYGRYQVAEKDGARCSAASGFLEPVVKRKNLNVVTAATVKKITFNGNEATGVDVMINGVNNHVGLSQGGEVLLTGGAISSPQILMLSGVGPQEHLAAHGIDVVHNLPGVGQNLQDHPATVVSYECSEGNKGVSVTSVIRIRGTTITNPRVALDWVLNRSGPLTSTGCDHGGFFKTKEDLASPDLQLRFLAAKALSADGMGTFTKVCAFICHSLIFN